MTDFSKYAFKLLKKQRPRHEVIASVAKEAGISPDDAQRAVELAELRLRACKRFSKAYEMFFDPDGLEMATPEELAKYRAQRLKCDTLLELGSGIGGDTVFIAQQCKRVVAVESNLAKIELAKKNCAVFGIENVEFINRDIKEYDLAKSKADKAFADPTRRLPDGTRVTSLSKTIPSITWLVKRLSTTFDSFCIEAPHAIAPKAVPYDCEKEYASIDGQLCGLSLYFGHMKKCERSAVVLPKREVLCYEGANKRPVKSKPLAYIYEIDPAVVAAKLVAQLAKDLENSARLFTLTDTLLTSDGKIDSPFFKNKFRFHAIVKDEAQLLPLLQTLKASKVVLRGKMDPTVQLAKKRSLEAKLNGHNKIHLFFGDKGIMVCECMNLE